MNIGIRYKDLYWELGDVARDIYDDSEINLSEINLAVEELIDGAESCLTMISDRTKLTDEQFYELLLKFAYIIGWGDYDCYHVLELVYNLKFVNYTVIKTTMHANVQKNEGHGRSFDRWDEEVGVDFRILYTKDFMVDDYEHFYTIEEIKKLVEEKKILIICEEERNLAWDEDDYEIEEYQNFDYAYDNYSMKHEFFDKNGKFYLYTLKYIRSMIDKKELLQLFKEYLDHSNREIYAVTHKSCWNGKHFKKAAEEYSSEFKKQGYAKRLKKLNGFKPYK